jgi:ubiquinone/menaquinone biosynthesis C-methylase UbiE
MANCRTRLSLFEKSKQATASNRSRKGSLDQIPPHTKRILDLGTGDGHILSIVKSTVPSLEGVGLDFSDTMLTEAKKRFANTPNIELIKHDFNVPLPTLKLGKFDVVTSSMAIHHLTHKRKKQLYVEVFGLLKSGGVFCNLDRVTSPTKSLHLKFLKQVGQTPETEDPSNKLLDLETQLGWFKEIGFVDVDCYWKWLEWALLVGYKPV